MGVLSRIIHFFIQRVKPPPKRISLHTPSPRVNFIALVVSSDLRRLLIRYLGKKLQVNLSHYVEDYSTSYDTFTELHLRD